MTGGEIQSVPHKKLADFAPEMLTLLERIVNAADDPDNETDKDFVYSLNWKKIRSVLSKAKKAQK